MSGVKILKQRLGGEFLVQLGTDSLWLPANEVDTQLRKEFESDARAKRSRFSGRKLRGQVEDPNLENRHSMITDGNVEKNRGRKVTIKII
jgi:hypothetical protein